ncbi:hypothetical protein ACW5WG_10490, partial [Aeromonas salmonicida]
MGRQRHNLLLVSITLLFLFSSGCGLYLQHRQEQLVDTFYRNIHWNISQVMLESQRFLYDGVVAQISQQIMISPAPSDRYTRGFLTGRP